MTPEPLTPSTGLCVLHLFCKPRNDLDGESVRSALKEAEASEVQVVPVAVVGHKADVAFMALSADLWRLRELQTNLQAAGLEIVDSYMSLTEVSEYAQAMIGRGLSERMIQARLNPTLPPEGKRAFCFYPMTKRREAQNNWYRLPYEERERLMHEHGSSGRKFSGRVIQLVTGSTGLDDYEWGVTLFADRPDDLKEVVYTMRFDEASALYAEFGRFYTGAVCSIDELMAALGRP